MNRVQAPVENTTCGQCGMLVQPADAFHPYLYCLLRGFGVLDPARFLEAQHFIPDPTFWGEDAHSRQSKAAR